MDYTSHLNLKKPAYTNPADIQDINDNMDAIDSRLKLSSAYVTASGTNSYTTSIPGIASLSEGLCVKVKFTNANTGACTLNVNSLGVKSILKGNGNALLAGNIKAGQICHLIYNGSNFQLLGEGGEYGTATAADVLNGKTIGTENGIIEGTMPDRGTVNQTLTQQNQQFTIADGKHSGLGKIIVNIANLIAGNVKSGVNVGGVVGTFNGPNVIADDIGGYMHYNGSQLNPKSEVAPNVTGTQNVNYALFVLYRTGTGAAITITSDKPFFLKKATGSQSFDAAALATEYTSFTDTFGKLQGYLIYNPYKGNMSIQLGAGYAYIYRYIL